MTKGTLQGTRQKQKRKSGFRVRMKTLKGRKIISSRRRKGRKKISI